VGLVRAAGEAESEEAKTDALDVAEAAILALFSGRGVEAAASPPLAPARYRLEGERSGLTKRLSIHASQEAVFFLTLGRYADGRLGELFVREKRESSSVAGYLDALATALSIGLQYGIPWEEFGRKLSHQRFEPSGLTDDEDHEFRVVSSPVDYIARWISKRAAGWQR
jgi:ribonucleoside-diphosphate reductase alpha chain